MPFKTAWTVEGLDKTFCSSGFPLFNASIGVNGEEIGVSSDELASNFLEPENCCNKRTKNES